MRSSIGAIAPDAVNPIAEGTCAGGLRLSFAPRRLAASRSAWPRFSGPPSRKYRSKRESAGAGTVELETWRIWPVVSRQRNKRDPLAPCNIRQPFKAVAPIIEAAEAAHDDEARARGHIGVKIHGHGMAQFLKARQPEARKRFRTLLAQAAASAERSLSLNESAMILAGVWPRSTAVSVSSSDVEGMASRCIAASSPSSSGKAKPYPGS